MKFIGNIEVLLSSGNTISFNLGDWETYPTLPFAWGAGYTQKDLEILSGFQIDYEDAEEFGNSIIDYTFPSWLFK